MKKRKTGTPENTHAPQCDVPELPRPRWTDGRISLYCGEAAQILPLLPVADLLLTDPPYGIDIAKRGHIGSNGRNYGRKQWDRHVPPLWLMELAISRARQSIIWGGTYIGLGRATCTLVWDKQNDGRKFSQAELAWTNLQSLATRMFRYDQQWARIDKVTRIHPTQKPVPLLEWCLSKAKGVESVIDPFAGSASTLVACMRLGLRAVGIEREPDYCRDAAKRLEAEAASRLITFPAPVRKKAAA